MGRGRNPCDAIVITVRISQALYNRAGIMNDEVPIGSSAMQCPSEQLRVTCEVHRESLDESPTNCKKGYTYATNLNVQYEVITYLSMSFHSRPKDYPPPPIYMRIHIQESSKFRAFGDRLHEGAIRIPFKQVAARMKLISLRLLVHSKSASIPLFADLSVW